MRRRTPGLAGTFALGVIVLLGQARAQGPPGPPTDGGRGGPPEMGRGPGPRGPMDRTAHLTPPGRWWSDPHLVQLLQLTAAQQKAMDNVFEQNRAKLIDLNSVLRREEEALKPLVAADTLEEARIVAQVDRVAQARADLEKANGRMLIELRKLLAADQWRRLQADNPANQSHPPPHRR